MAFFLNFLVFEISSFKNVIFDQKFTWLNSLLYVFWFNLLPENFQPISKLHSIILYGTDDRIQDAKGQLDFVSASMIM